MGRIAKIVQNILVTAKKKKKNENDFLLKTDLREKKNTFHDIVFIVDLVAKKLE